MKAMRILVYGAGVQGSLYASRLAESGHDVALLARGARLAELRARGILLEDILTGRTTTTVVPIVDRLEPGDAFDLVLIPVRREQIASVLPALAAAKHVPALCFMHNHAGGSSSLAKAVGAERVVLGFPGAGGARGDDGVVRYGLIAQQPTTIGELDGRITPRLELLEHALRGAGFRTALSRHMEAWLTAHAVFVTALSGALYRRGGDPAKVAAARDDVALFVRAVREGFGALGPSGLANPPTNLRAIFEWLPMWIGVAYWRRYLAAPAADHFFGHHARAATGEMRALVDDLRALLPAPASVPSLRTLWAAVDAYAAECDSTVRIGHLKSTRAEAPEGCNR